MENVQMNSLSIIENVNLQQIQGTLTKIAQFQQLVQNQLKQNHDYGIIPGTPKPTLLKPGAEKILMLMGLRSEFEIVDSTRDFEKGFFQYQVRCKLYRGDILITEGLGAANTKERKYLKQDPFTIDNTVLKIAKKRALIDATLLVASLSEVFTQDIEDMDLVGNQLPQNEQQRQQQNLTPDSDDTISKAQAKRMYALAKGDAELCKRVMQKYGYEKSEQVKKVDYNKICEEIEAEVAAEEELPFK
jgi:hypothetical protein